MKKLKTVILGITLALGLGGMAAVHACPRGPRVIVKRCHMTRWGQQCRVIRRGCRGRRWGHYNRRVYGSRYYGPQIRWGIQIG